MNEIGVKLVQFSSRNRQYLYLSKTQCNIIENSRRISEIIEREHEGVRNPHCFAG